MTPQEQIAVLRRVFQEGFNENNMDVIDECYHEDYEFVAPTLPGQVPPKGREAFKARVQAFGSAFEGIHYQIQEAISEGNIVATNFIFGGKHIADFAGFAATGRDAQLTGVHFTRFEGDKIKSTWAGFTNIMEQLGPKE